MALTTLTHAPNTDDFTPLSEHQEQTPPTFFASRPVLHLQSPGTTLQIRKEELQGQVQFEQLIVGEAGVEGEDDVEIQNVDVWVTSRYLALWSTAAAKGVQIPYTAITVHAQVGSAILLELNLSDSNVTPDEDIEHLQLRITPTSITDSASTSTSTASAGAANGSTQSPSTALYKAIGDCQELNPDPADKDSDGDGYGEEGGAGGFDETAPGATGWITSENMADFVDENGNFRMPEGTTVIGGEEEESLGQGAGRRRGADEVDDDEDEGGKWQRTG